MQIGLLTCLTLLAFAANSLLNRAALSDTGMDAAFFTLVRVLFGALMLGVLVRWRGGRAWHHGTWQSAAWLMLYAGSFSLAYLSLDAGLGALVLFGGVQVTMFAGALLRGAHPGIWRWVGSALGLCGLAVLFLPGAAQPDLLGLVLMLAAAVGWGIYSLRGQGSKAPLEETAGNFLRAVPMAGAFWMVAGGSTEASFTGVSLAIASGAFASGLGYALWYAVLPRIDATIAAIAQLSVPLIALVGGMLFLGETVSPLFAIAAVLTLGGILLAIFADRRR